MTSKRRTLDLSGASASGCRSYGVPGVSLSVIDGGEIVDESAYGVRERESATG